MELVGEYYHVIQIKFNQLVEENVHMIDKAYLSDIRVTSSFTYKMAAESMQLA